MSEPLFSPSWYRVARLRPRLRGHTRIYRHVYRDEVWFVLQDHAKGRYYRFTPNVHQMLGKMDGRATIQELWERASEALGDDAPTQSEIVQLLTQLHAADVLVADVSPDTEELLDRSERIERARRVQSIRSPLAIRIPLIDPERFLERTIGLVRPLFSRTGAVLWVATVAIAVALGVEHWDDLTSNVVDRVLATQNLVLLWFVYPAVKALHELGHGYAVKTWGGEVHEMGIMFLVFMPVPYVDASAASEFRSKRRRMVVGSAGIMVELFVSSIALFAWIALEPGLARSVAFNVVLIGSVSTLLFNGNPLLRYDGYYIFSDLLEIPNLGQRSLGHLGWWVRRRVLGVRDEPEPYAAPGERGWLLTYAVCAFVYRMFVYAGIVLFVAGKFFFIGVILALWAAFNMVVTPVSKAIRYVAVSPVLRESRGRAAVTTAGLVAAGLAVLFVVPLPLRTRAEGVVWVPERALVRAATDGFVDRVLATPNGEVAPGDPLVAFRDPMLESETRVLAAKLEELDSRYDAAMAHDKVQARIVDRERAHVRERLVRSRERRADLEIASLADGTFVLPDAEDLPGRYVHKGELLGYVLNVDRPTVRAVVPQSRIDLVRSRTRAVEVRFEERIELTIPARVQREVPEAEQELPSTILGSGGGGEIATDPFEGQGTRAFERVFQFDLALEQPVDRVFVGGRVHVRFDHGTEPLAFQAWRKLRQMFLRRFHV